MPAPETPFTLKRTAQNDTAHLTQAGWSIDYAGYRHFGAMRLPEKIILSQGEKKITLIIQNFKAEA